MKLDYITNMGNEIPVQKKHMVAESIIRITTTTATKLTFPPAIREPNTMLEHTIKAVL